MSSVQNLLIFLLMFLHIQAKKPPGYVEPPKEYDPSPPNYEYGYRILDEKGGQGKDEKRDGDFAKGRYYVQGKNSSQNVEYIADDWGYHPVVEYSSVGPHSRSRTKFAIGEESIKQLKTQDGEAPTNEDGLRKDTNESPVNERPEINIGPTSNEQISTQSSLAPVDIQSTTPVSQSQALEELDPTEPNRQHILIQPQTQLPQLSDSLQQFTLQPSAQAVQPQLNGILFQQQLQDIAVDSSTQQKEQSEQASAQYIYQHDEGGEKGQDIFFIQHHGNPVLFQQFPTVDIKSSYTKNLILQPQKLVTEPQIPPQETVLLQGEYAPPNLGQIFLAHNTNEQELALPRGGIILKQEGTNENADTLQKQKIINQAANQKEQLVLLQEQNYPLNYQDQKVLYNTNIVHRQDQSVAEENINGNTQIIQNRAEVKSTENNFKEFGAKLSSQNSIETIQSLDASKSLIESTKNLISGQDVLNINEAISNEEHAQSQTESSTPSSVLINPSAIAHSTSTTPISIVSEASLLKQPIVVAELNEESILSTTRTEEVFVSSTVSPTKEGNSVVVTPRPVSTKFLAPITAGIQLTQQSTEQKTEEAQQQVQYAANRNVVVEVQQSVPYYLGKYEYPSAYAAEYNAAVNGNNQSGSDIEFQVKQDLALGKTLLLLPTGQVQPLIRPQINDNIVEIQYNHITQQQLPSPVITKQFTQNPQEEVHQEQILTQQGPTENPSQESEIQTDIANPSDQQQFESTKIIEQPVSVPQEQQQAEELVTVEKLVDNPVHVTHYLQNHVPQSYYIQGAVDTAYQLSQHVQVPAEEAKIVENPVQITQYIENPILVPQPYPVQTVVETPVHVPYEVTKYIEKPYPVGVPVPVPQPYPVDRIVEKKIPVPYPVEKVVEKIVKQAYPVEVQVPVPQPYPVDRIVEKKIPVPYPVEKIVEKIVKQTYPVKVQVPVPQPYPVDRIVEKKIPVPYPVEKVVEKIVKQPYPVEVRVPYPQPVETIVEKQVPVPYEVERVVQKVLKQPYPIPYRVPYPYPHPVPFDKKVPVPYFIDRPIENIVEKPIPQFYNIPYPVEVKVPMQVKVPTSYVKTVNLEVPKPYPDEVPKYISKPKYTTVFLGQYQGATKGKDQKVQGGQKDTNSYLYNPYAYAPSTNQYLPPKQEIRLNKGRVPWKMFVFNINGNVGNSYKTNNLNNGYLPPAGKQENDNSNRNKDQQIPADSNQHNLYYTIKHDNGVGLSPPKYRYNVNDNGQIKQSNNYYRSARSSFDEKSVRMEYGFMPPLIPSLEIDEQGQPIEKDKR